MSPEHAERIALRLAGAWPRSQVSTQTWLTELVDLDRARAEQACRQLIRSSERAPSIAAFLAAYRALVGTAGTDRECPDCQNTGWVTCNDHPAHWPGVANTIPKIPDSYLPDDGCLCNAVRPCHCAHGAHQRHRWSRNTPAPKPTGASTPTTAPTPTPESNRHHDPTLPIFEDA